MSVRPPCRAHKAALIVFFATIFAPFMAIFDILKRFSFPLLIWAIALGLWRWAH